MADEDLYNAFRARDLDGMVAALERGANPNLTLSYSTSVTSTILYEAAKTGDAAMVQALIAAAADARTRSMATSVTPLHAAVSFDNPALVKALVDAGGRRQCRGERRQDAADLRVDPSQAGARGAKPR